MKVSAPGKLLLFGDHAVVYGHPCIVTAVQTRLEVAIELTTNNEITVDTPGTNNQLFITTAIELAKNSWPIPSGFCLSTRSPFTGKYGLGSSSAVTVATLYALSLLSGVHLSRQELFDYSYQVVLSVQGVGSGFDVAAAVFGGTILYQKEKPIEPIKHSEYSLMVGYTGKKADTVAIVTEVQEQRKMNPKAIDDLFFSLTELTYQAKQTMVEGSFERFGLLMTDAHRALRKLGVSSDELETLITAAIDAGAWGAKLSGAGRGDCMVAIGPESKRKAIEESIRVAGGEVLPLLIDAEGVKQEL